MPDRKTALGNLAVGDICHAESPNGASLVCLVLSVTETTIRTRTVTTQLHIEFDRQTGIAEWGDERVLCTIDSTARLPSEIHDVMLGLDRKFRFERDPERIKLTDAEKRASVFIHSFYASNRL